MAAPARLDQAVAACVDEKSALRPRRVDRYRETRPARLGRSYSRNSGVRGSPPNDRVCGS